MLEEHLLGESTGKTVVDLEQLVHVIFVACKNDDNLLEVLRLREERNHLIDCLLRKPSSGSSETVRFIDKQHTTQRLVEHLLRLGTSMSDVLSYEIRCRAFVDVDRREESHIVVHLSKLPRHSRLSGAWHVI